MAKFNFNQNAGFYMIDPMTIEGNGKDNTDPKDDPIISVPPKTLTLF